MTSPTVNPFVSEQQRKACYARDDPDWDCDEWEAKTPSKLPKRKKKAVRNRRLWWKRPVCNAKKRRTGQIDPTRTITLRRAFIAELRKRFALLKGRISKLIVDEDSLGLKEPQHVPFTTNCAGRVLEVPDIRQPNHFYCGACSTFAVTQYFEVGPSTLESTARTLGTTVEKSTHPTAIVDHMLSLGLEVEARGDMTVDDLMQYIGRGMPVICPVQDYAGRRDPKAEFDYGHYLTVIGVIDNYVICQDSSIENEEHKPGGDVPKSQEDPDEDIDAPGRVLIYKADWERVWHDQDVDGNKFIHYGIAVGRKGVENVEFDSIAGHNGTVYWENFRPSLVDNTRWKFHTDSEKIDAFQDWLRSQFDSTLRGKTEEQLWKLYIERGFQKGAGRAFDDVNSKLKNKPDVTSDFYAGGRDQFLRSSFALPESVDKVKLLAARAFDDLDGVTDEMETKLSRALTDGLVEGRNPLDIADDLADQLDIGQNRAETIARTELIRAHAEGQLVALDRMGVEEVGVAVEWEVAGDEKVCPLCSDLDGVVLKIDEARNMLPRHPNCRCCWIPANVGEDDDDQKRSKDEIEEASDDYLDVDSDRPKGIFNVHSHDQAPHETRYAGAGGTFAQSGGRDCGEQSSHREADSRVTAAMGWVSENAFCATGKGGGVDPSCGKGGALGGHNLTSLAKVHAPHLHSELVRLRKEKAKYKKAGDKAALKVAQKRLQDIKREVVAAKEGKMNQFLDKQQAKKLADDWKAGQKAGDKSPIADVPKAEGKVETDLQTQTVKEIKNNGGGCNETYRVTLADGTKGMWKPASGEMEGLRGNIKAGTFYKREAAAYSVAKEIGMTDLVPPTVVREINGKVGSIQKFVPNAREAEGVIDPYDGAKDCARAAAYDYMVGNTDRHSGNWMVSKNAGPGGPADRQITLIDNGLCFPTSERGIRSKFITMSDSRGYRVPDEVKNWDAGKIRTALEGQGIEKAAIDGALTRLKHLQDGVGGRFRDLDGGKKIIAEFAGGW